MFTQSNRFIMATHYEIGFTSTRLQQIWMNRTKVPLPLLEAANSLCCALWSGVMWTTKLCWETDQHKQPRPVCFTLHRHHFLLESICGQTGIKIIAGRGKKNQSNGKYYTFVRSLEGEGPAFNDWHNSRNSVLRITVYLVNTRKVMFCSSILVSSLKRILQVLQTAVVNKELNNSDAVLCKPKYWSFFPDWWTRQMFLWSLDGSSGFVSNTIQCFEEN